MFTFDAPVEGSQDYWNRKKVSTLVKRHFALGEEGMKYFNKELYTPTLPEELVNLLGKDNSSLRVKKAIDDINYLEDHDNGWYRFRIRFRHFVAEYGVTYKHFRNGKIEIKKNEVKLRKAIVKHYTKIKNLAYINSDIFSYDHFASYKEEFTKRDEEIIIREIDYQLNHIGTIAAPKCETLEIGITANFTDWFLCSTGEQWSSCLSLKTNYEYAYWTGLPGLVGDKSRFMVYITKGGIKSYKGISTDSFIARSWAEITEEGKIVLLNWYPSKYIDASVINKTFDTDVFVSSNDDDEWISKYPVNLLYDKEENSRFIYQDYSGFYTGKDGNVYISGGCESGHTYKSRYRNSFEHADLFDVPYSLSDLIDNGQDVYEVNETGNYYCDECGDRIPRDCETYHGGSYFCESCIDEITVYTEDAGRVWTEEAVYVESEDYYYTESYVDRNFVTSEHDDLLYRTEDCIEVYGANGIYYVTKRQAEENPDQYVKLKNGDWACKEDCVFDEETDAWYTDDEWSEIEEEREAGQLELELVS